MELGVGYGKGLWASQKLPSDLEEISTKSSRRTVVDEGREARLELEPGSESSTMDSWSNKGRWKSYIQT